MKGELLGYRIGKGNSGRMEREKSLKDQVHLLNET